MSQQQIIVEGRPDTRDRNFGKTLAKRHPAYVYSKGPNASLVHKVAYVELDWYELISMHAHRRLNKPKATAHTVCGMFLYLRRESIRPSRKARALMCEVPAPDAVLCGKCHGEMASFGPHGAATKAGITRQQARKQLGCIVEGYGFGV